MRVSIADAEDVLETCNHCLDDLWKLDDFLYPQHRMIHLMEIITHGVTRFIQSKCATLELWKAPYAIVEETLLQVNINCGQNMDLCRYRRRCI